jgi:uncharacterized protein
VCYNIVALRLGTSFSTESGAGGRFGCWRFFFTNGVRMRFNVSHLVKAPIGVRDVVHLDVSKATLGDDLLVHQLRGDISLTRTSGGLLAEGQLDVFLDGECVRCLASFPLPLTVQPDDLSFALPQASSEDGEYRISEHGWVDMTLALREQILLNIPFSPLCRPDCKGLCGQCGQDLNIETCDCDTQAIDPRLAVLRDLL